MSRFIYSLLIAIAINEQLCCGRIAQLGEHRPYKPGVTGSIPVPPTRDFVGICGVVVQLVRTLACHARGREFESRRPRHFLRFRPFCYNKVKKLPLPLKPPSFFLFNQTFQKHPYWGINHEFLFRRCLQS